MRDFKTYLFTHHKESNICNTFHVLMFQQFLVYKHQGLRDDLAEWVDYELPLAHGCADKNVMSTKRHHGKATDLPDKAINKGSKLEGS